jgi:hypothetical protein
MKGLAFFIAITGLISLFLYLKFSIPLNLTNQNQIKYLEDNQKVIIKGTIENQNIYENNILFHLTNNLTLNCDKPCPIKNSIKKEISVLASYNKFYNSFDLIKEVES